MFPPCRLLLALGNPSPGSAPAPMDGQAAMVRKGSPRAVLSSCVALCGHGFGTNTDAQGETMRNSKVTPACAPGLAPEHPEGPALSQHPLSCHNNPSYLTGCRTAYQADGTDFLPNTFAVTTGLSFGSCWTPASACVTFIPVTHSCQFAPSKQASSMIVGT